ncbi:hypothetical protein MSPP1_003771 [Malassezia sp. CBS 17886]|nr:hypothetical protein MSPP1_003771 [Malassezia sp. CBS 17886]
MGTLGRQTQRRPRADRPPPSRDAQRPPAQERTPHRSPSHDSPSARGPILERSGLLAKESNSVNGVALKYHEPPEAKRPRSSWRMFVFKDGKELDMLVLGRQSCYLLGRDRGVADIPIEHPSCSKQHAVIQFRQVTNKNEFGDVRHCTLPFLIDLDSANGCTVNGADVPASRYYELRSGDTCQFGASSREYVLLDEAAAQT